MAAGKKQQQGVMVAAEPSVAKRMWRVLRAVLYMLRRGLPSGRKLAMDLHLLFHRGKIAGKALGDLLAFHHHHGHRDATGFSYAGAASGGSSSFSCRALDPGLAVHEPSSRARTRREVEFSCSNTPSSADFGGLLLGKRGRRSSRHRRRDDAGGYLHYYNYDAADVARVFEMLNDDEVCHVDDHEPAAAYETPSPAQMLWALARSPALSKHLRVAAESPAAGSGRDGDGRAQVDRQADEFIRRFYEQLRAQKSAASTPDYYGYSAAASPFVSGGRRTPRALPAAIA